MSAALGEWIVDTTWTDRATELRADLTAFVNSRTADDGVWPPPWTRPVVIGGVLWYSTLFFS